ncbi:hypothetical protein HZB88_00620 [archaeon]|nr:hypothetical protein [archaeon]
MVFDSSTIISLAMNNLLWLLSKLKKRYKGGFFIPQEIKREVVDTPLNSKRFAFEALQVQAELNSGILKGYEKTDYLLLAKRIDELVNNMFFAYGSPMKPLHKGEICALALAKTLDADALAVDERSTRAIIENPLLLKNLFEQKLHTKIEINMDNMKEFLEIVSNIRIIRSSELCLIARELGMFDNLSHNMPKSKIIDAVLWAVKLDGCSISIKEIEEAKRAV